ncbi:TIGR02450 family Trp-rich protein [Shewanella insulae]|uniref:TIGR02450 family Trp-rich protein n=1 Tax=Shewanella insulae TaxID=2681496 RepID=A0A6L7HYR2_9GAMM|nr:TIGR02450 family Trp-rich protein [Shewanella insulae]MXR68824.1 TIGR02450 family Trp-rich protein [Shewanella insulae]
MNRLHPKKLLQSKWTKVTPQAREKHFIVIEVDYDEHRNVQGCVIEALHSGRQYAIDWRSLKDSDIWLVGWR